MEKKDETISVAKGGITYSLETSIKDGVEIYGIRIICTLFGEREEFFHDDVTDNYETATELLNILADYVVLPCTALEIIDEYIDAKAKLSL